MTHKELMTSLLGTLTKMCHTAAAAKESVYLINRGFHARKPILSSKAIYVVELDRCLTGKAVYVVELDRYLNKEQ